MKSWRPKLLNKDVARVLDAVFQNSPAEPDWSAVREAIFTTGASQSFIVELVRVMFLYAEDPSAFDEYLYAIRED